MEKTEEKLCEEFEYWRSRVREDISVVETPEFMEWIKENYQWAIDYFKRIRGDKYEGMK